MITGGEILDHVMPLYHKALCDGYGEINYDDYRWIIGIDIFKSLELYTSGYLYTKEIDRSDARLTGIPVEIDYRNRSRLSLFKEVKLND